MRFSPAWLLVFVLGTVCGFFVSRLQTDAKQQVLRQQVAAWRSSQAAWVTERVSLQSEFGRLHDELLTAQAWIDRLERTLAESHGRLADLQSELHACERVMEGLMAIPKQ